MRLPSLHGLIRRRILVNYRVEADVMARYLPPPFRPRLKRGFAIAGICLIRLEQIRPRGWPRCFGISSENAAHRVAVLWDEPQGETREGVFIPRRDTGSRLNHLAGGRLFPGEHHLSDFKVTDRDGSVSIAIRAQDDSMSLDLRAHEASLLPETSCFSSRGESSAFFESGAVGYSVTRVPGCFHGIELVTEKWHVHPLAVDHVASSFFADATHFPPGSVTFDHALIMRDVQHRWDATPDKVV